MSYDRFHRFKLGQIVATPGAIQALEDANELPTAVLIKHAAGDWGVVSDHDKEANDQAVKDGDRILSAYVLNTGVKVWVITEADRSSSTILLPEEY